MKKYFLILALILIPSILFAWTEPAGSTYTATTEQALEIKDIVNEGWDKQHSAFEVYNISTGPYHNRMWVYDSDISGWIELKVSSANLDALAATLKAYNVKSFLYGYNGSTWDRLKSDGMQHLFTRCSTNSVAGIYYDGKIAHVLQASYDDLSSSSNSLLTQGLLYGFNGTNWDRLKSDQNHYLWVRASTDSLTGIYYGNNTAIVESDGDFHVRTSTNSEATIYYEGNRAIVRADGDINTRTSTNSYSTIYYEGNKAEVQGDNELRVESSTGSRTTLYYNGNQAIVQADGELEVESSTDSTASVYYNGYKAIVNSDGDFNVQTSTNSEITLYYEGNRAEIQGDRELRVESSTGSRITLYYNSNEAEVQADNDLAVETSTDSIASVYYNGVKAIVNSDGDFQARTSTNSKSTLYYEGNNAIVQSDGELKTETSTSSAVSIYYEGNKAIVEADGELRVQSSSSSVIESITKSVTIYITAEQYAGLKEDTTSTIENFPADYPDSTAQSSLASIDTNTGNIYNQMITSVTFVKLDYVNKVSTYTSGEIYADGTVVTNCDVDYFTFRALDGTTQIKWNAGSYIPIDETGSFQSGQYERIIKKNVTFTVDLISATTVWYYIKGVE